MKFLKDLLIRFGIYLELAGFLAAFVWFKFFKEDTENVTLIGGSNGRYYIKFKEFNSKSDIQLEVIKLLNKVNNDQTLVFDGGYKVNTECELKINSIEDLMNNVEYYREDQNKIIFRNQKCFLEKN